MLFLFHPSGVGENFGGLDLGGGVEYSVERNDHQAIVEEALPIDFALCEYRLHFGVDAVGGLVLAEALVIRRLNLFGTRSCTADCTEIRYVVDLICVLILNCFEHGFNLIIRVR